MSLYDIWASWDRPISWDNSFFLQDVPMPSNVMQSLVELIEGRKKNDNCSTWFASEKIKNHHRQGLNPAFLWFRFPLNQQLGGVQILLPFPFVLIIPNEFPHLQPKLPATMLLSGPWASWRFAKFRQGWVKTLNNWDFEWENLWTYHGD